MLSPATDLCRSAVLDIPRSEVEPQCDVMTKVCTTGGACIECDQSLADTIDQLQAAEKKDRKYWCCVWPPSGCVRIDQITTITPTRLDDEDDDDDDHGRPIFGNPDIVILTGGQKVLSKRRQRRAALADDEPATPDGEDEPG